jgi:hypothetical protein
MELIYMWLMYLKTDYKTTDHANKTLQNLHVLYTLYGLPHNLKLEKTTS